jgi:hypothetical protein
MVRKCLTMEQTGRSSQDYPLISPRTTGKTHSLNLRFSMGEPRWKPGAAHTEPFPGSRNSLSRTGFYLAAVFQNECKFDAAALNGENLPGGVCVISPTHNVPAWSLRHVCVYLRAFAGVEVFVSVEARKTVETASHSGRWQFGFLAADRFTSRS